MKTTVAKDAGERSPWYHLREKKSIVPKDNRDRDFSIPVSMALMGEFDQAFELQSSAFAAILVPSVLRIALSKSIS